MHAYAYTFENAQTVIFLHMLRMLSTRSHFQIKVKTRNLKIGRSSSLHLLLKLHAFNAADAHGISSSMSSPVHS